MGTQLRYISCFGIYYLARLASGILPEGDQPQLPRLALPYSSTFMWELFIVDHLLDNVHLITQFVFSLQYLSHTVNSGHFLALKMFGTLQRESNNLFRIKKLKYFEAEGCRFMKGLGFSVFKTIKYISKFRFLAFLEL